jgi:hypothetical protein
VCQRPWWGCDRIADFSSHIAQHVIRKRIETDTMFFQMFEDEKKTKEEITYFEA